MIHKGLSYWQVGLMGVVLAIAVGACGETPSELSAPAPQGQEGVTAADATPDTSTEVPPAAGSPGAEAAAVVSDVERSPVWLKSSQAEESAAQVGAVMAYGDTIRTEAEGLAQVDLDGGLAFRIGGEASLTLQPDNRLNLKTGEMLTWVEPGKQVPTEIVTSAGVAGLRGTTLFVLAPADPQGEVLFFSWEGTIRLRFEEQGEELLLESGEELRVRPGERDVVALRRRVRRLVRREIRQRRRESRLLNEFRRSLPTQDAIERSLEAAP